jgi:hypothetical protein
MRTSSRPIGIATFLAPNVRPVYQGVADGWDGVKCHRRAPGGALWATRGSSLNT